MIDFCPDGYVALQEAVFIAAKFWFPEKVASLEAAVTDKPWFRAVDSSSYPHLPEELRHAFEEIACPAVQRLRSFLHHSKLKAYYFNNDGCHFIPHGFWATVRADGVIESGTYWPFGTPTAWYDQRLNYPIFVKQWELDALLVKAAENWRFPLRKKPELAAAFRRPEIAALPTRDDQRKAIEQLEEFKSYHITDELFCEAAKASGQRRPGVKRRQGD